MPFREDCQDRGEPEPRPHPTLLTKLTNVAEHLAPDDLAVLLAVARRLAAKTVR